MQGARTLVALSQAYLSFLGVFCAGVAILLVGQPAAQVAPRLVSALMVGAGFGLLHVVGLVTVHLPVFAGAPGARALRSRAGAYAVGGALGLVPFAALVVLLQEPGDSLTGLARFWLRVPGEAVFGVLPFVVSGGVFGAAMRQGALDGRALAALGAGR